MAVETYTTDIEALLGDEAESLLQHTSETFPKECLHLPGPDFVDRVLCTPTATPRCCATCSGCSTTAASAARLRLDPAGRPGHRALRRRVLRAQPASTSTRRTSSSSRSRAAATPSPPPSACSASVARKYAHEDPVHRQDQSQRAAELPEHVRPDAVRQRRTSAWEMGAAGVGATIYCGSAGEPPPARSRSPRPSRRRTSSACSPCSGATCATPPSRRTADYHVAADLTGQANHLGVTIEADIIKQKLPENNGGYNAPIGFGKTDKLVYDEAHDRPPDRPLPLPGRQLLHGPRRLINSRRRVRGRRPTWPRRCAPRSSTSAPAAWA